MWTRYNYLKIWNLRVQKKKKIYIEKITFKHGQIKFLAMHTTNKKLSFNHFWPIVFFWLQIYPMTSDWFCGPGSRMWKDLFYHAARRELGRFFDYYSNIHNKKQFTYFIHEVTKLKLAGPNSTGGFIKHWKTRKVLETSFYFIYWIWNGSTGLALHFVWQFLHLKFIYLSAFHEELKAFFLSWFILCIIHKIPIQ